MSKMSEREAELAAAAKDWAESKGQTNWKKKQHTAFLMHRLATKHGLEPATPEAKRELYEDLCCMGLGSNASQFGAKAKLRSDDDGIEALYD